MAASPASFERSSVECAPVVGAAGSVIAVSVDHDPAMVGAARRAVGAWLRERGCLTGDDALLVLSELVTNAMAHAGAGCTIVARHRDGLLRLEVGDRSSRAPVMRRVAPSDVGGRGLHVIDAVAEAWGWEPTADGKLVWAIVHAAVHRGDDRAESTSP